MGRKGEGERGFETEMIGIRAAEGRDSLGEYDATRFRDELRCFWPGRGAKEHVVEALAAPDYLFGVWTACGEFRGRVRVERRVAGDAVLFDYLLWAEGAVQV